MFKKVMKSKKGFSMIELLAAIAILGMLSIVAIASVQSILNKSTDEYYKEQENSMSMAAQSYYQNNRNKLPKSTGHIKSVKLSELMSSNYIEQIKSKSEKNCSSSDSYVEVIKYSQTDYQYVAILDCGAEYKTNNSRGTDVPTVNITMPTIAENETVKNVTIKGNIQGDAENKSKLISYSYVIYAAPMGTNRFKAVKNSGSVISRGKSKEININVDQYLPAKIKVQITAINEHGKKKVVTSPAKEYKDIKYPLCPDDIDDTTMNIGSSKTWANIPSRTIKVICRDADGVGCARPYFTQVFTNEAKTDVLKIQDRSGNEHTCRVNVYIDRNYPSLKVTLKNNSGGTINSVTANDSTKKNVESGWQGKKVSVAYSASDTLGLKSIKIQKSGPHKSKTATPSYDKGTTKNLEAPGYLYTKNSSGNLATVSEDGHTKFKITLTDLSGKKVVVEAIVSYDATKPTLTLTNSSNSKWTNKDVTITAEHTDATSEIKKLEYSYNNSTWTNMTIDTPTKTTEKWTAERDNTLYVRATDSAGNTTTKTTKVRIDKTGPKVTLTNSSSGNWTNKNVTITATNEDPASGLKSVEYSHNNSTWSTSNWDSTSTLAKTTGTWSGERNNTFYVKVTDNVGNTTTKTTAIKIDKTKPTLTLTNSSSGNWTNKDVTITASHSDGASKIKKLEYGYNNSTWTSWSMDSTTKTTGKWTAERNDTLYVKLTDNAGNTETKTTKVKIDKTKPSITTSTNKTKESGGWYKASSDSPFKPTIKCTYGDSGRKTFKIGSTTYDASTKTYSLTSSYRPKTYNVTCTDTAGNTATKTVEYYVRVYGRDSSCDCATYESCPNSSCDCKTYKYTWKYRKCNRGSCKSCVKGGTAKAPGCNSPSNNTCKTWYYNWGSWGTNSGSTYPGSQTSTCTESKVGKFNRQKTKTECTARKSCRHSSCGCETRAKCWHY